MWYSQRTISALGAEEAPQRFLLLLTIKTILHSKKQCAILLLLTTGFLFHPYI